MDLLRLNPQTYLADDLIEGYTSLIWTERYVGSGEFELKTFQVEETLPLLPEGTLLSLRDSNEVMMVDTRTIGESSEGYQELTIRGHSFETFLENRVLIADTYNTPWPTLKSYTLAQMGSLLLWNHLVNATGEDPTKVNQTIDAQTAIPNTVVTNSAILADPPQEWWLEEGTAYSLLKDLLAISGIGVRTIRPNRTTGDVVTFDTTRTASRGTYSSVSTSNITQLRFDICSGLDRSRFQSTRPAVIFHYDSGHIDSPSYLRSILAYRNMAIIVSSIGPIVVQANPPAGSGMNRRVLYLDGGDIGSQDTATFQDALIQKAKNELKSHNTLYLFDGAISPIAPYKYGVDYFLGDRVSLMAMYDVDQTMFVSEYIRTEDAEGDRGYPGLSSIST